MGILDGSVVELLIVDAELVTSVFLSGHDYGCCPGAHGGSEDALLWHLLGLFFFFFPSHGILLSNR